MSQNRGGPNRNQGRKPNPNKLVALPIRVRPDQKEWLESQPSKQQAVRDAIDFYKEHKG